jgi:phosphate starvation-inducible protein PhoH
MQRTFREFVELAEGKKKDIKRLKSAYLAGQQQAAPQIVNYGDSAPNSPERAAQIAAMMRDSGGGAVKKAIKKKEEQAEKAAKKLLKKEGFSYGSKSYQQELEKKRKEKENQRRQEMQQTSDQLYRERTRGRGIRAVHKGQSGWMKDGKFTPDT